MKLLKYSFCLALLLAVPMLSVAQSSVTITANGVSFKMVRVQGGTFTMGATSEQGSDAFDDEKPAHKVTLSDYYIGETEVTQALWKAVMGSNPSEFTPAEADASRGSYDDFVANAKLLNAKKPGTVRIPTRNEWNAAMVTTKGSLQKPVENVNWEDCQTFIKKLNQLTGKKFRLPTEAEWEFAARGGVKSKGYKYAGSNSIGDVAWYTDNSSSTTHDVGSKRANELGLYDMAGNVWEWCSDWYGDYSFSSQTNPRGASSGSDRVRRGGGWSSGARGCRVSNRNYNTSTYRDYCLGLRLAF